MAMPYYRIVVTTGVSAFGGANVLRAWAQEHGLLVFPTPSPNPVPPEGKTAEQTLADLARAAAMPGGLEGVVSDPRRVSAEYSAIAALRKEGRISENPQVVLIHTDTLGGKASALLLAALLKADFGANVECRECPMNVNDRAALRANLGDFMQRVASELRDYDPHGTCFAPLGGFKVMTSLGYLAGAYFGFPTLYTHEDNQVVHEVPAIPVRVPEDDLRALAPLVRKVGSGCALAELAPAEVEQAEAYSWVFERADDLLCVNAFGLFLMQENPGIFGTRLRVARRVDREFDKDPRKGFVLQQLGVLAAKLVAGSQEADLRHERDWDLDHQEGWHLYKGASNGVHILRALYRYEPEEPSLVVKMAWTDHDRYESELTGAWHAPLDPLVEWDLE